MVWYSREAEIVNTFVNTVNTLCEYLYGFPMRM